MRRKRETRGGRDENARGGGHANRHGDRDGRVRGGHVRGDKNAKGGANESAKVGVNENAGVDRNDFSKGGVVSSILRLAAPITLAQLINVLYNVVDRVYISYMPSDAMISMTGLGLALPIITMIAAFSNLIAMGGAPLCSIERGRGDHGEAERIMGNSFALLLAFGAALTAMVLLLKKPLLYAFGASDVTYPFADAYLTVYVTGSLFVMCGLGMNSFINAQGFGKIGMWTVLIGALFNIALDPLFIFAFNMGVRGAALATVISQCASAAWILRFLTGKKTILRLQARHMKLLPSRVKRILTLGLSGFTMSLTNSTVQIVCNVTLRNFGGDMYVGIMTVINSLREVVFMPMQGLSQAAQPVMGYNYGAGAFARVRKAIQFTAIAAVAYTTAAWLAVFLLPEWFIRVFNRDQALIAAAIPALHVYFFGFFLMSLQHSGQAVFVALGKSRHAIFFSLFRKVIIVTPLTLILPRLAGLGTTGVFLAEPISNLLGGGACFATMMLTVWPELRDREYRH